MKLKVGCLRAHVGRDIRTKPLLKALDERIVCAALDPLKVWCRCDVPRAYIEAHGRDFGFRRGQAGNGHLFRIEPSIRVGLIKKDRSLPDHGGKDRVGPKPFDVLNDRQELLAARAEIDIALADDRAAIGLSADSSGLWRNRLCGRRQRRIAYRWGENNIDRVPRTGGRLGSPEGRGDARDWKYC